MSKKDYHDMIKQLRDERVDVDKVYIGDFKPEKDTIEEVIEDVIVLEEPYVPQRFRDEDKETIAQEIHDIADSAVFAHLMDTAEKEVPVFSMKKDLAPHKEEDMEILLIETEETADVVDYIDMGELVGLMSRNWKALKELTNTQIRNAMINIYSDKESVVVEAAVDTALYLVRAEEKAA